MVTVDWHVSNEEARLFECTRCFAEIGMPCTKVLTSAYGVDPQTVAHWKVNREVGQKMVNVHTERRLAALVARQVAEEEAVGSAETPLQAYRKIAWALHEFDHREQATLSWWLRTHGHILWEQDSA